MRFLPVRINGQKVYAGFWSRFCSAWVDIVIFTPVTLIYLWLAGLDRSLALVIAVPYFILSSLYVVFFHARFGGTPGKLALGIRITKPDGSRIGWKEAWKRSSVDIVFSFFVLVFQVLALILVDPGDYASKNWLQKGTIVLDFFPDSYHTIQGFQNIWFWGEFIVLLLNERKRALHDFIAETVVIQKEFAKTEA